MSCCKINNAGLPCHCDCEHTINLLTHERDQVLQRLADMEKSLAEAKAEKEAYRDAFMMHLIDDSISTGVVIKEPIATRVDARAKKILEDRKEGKP